MKSIDVAALQMSVPVPGRLHQESSETVIWVD